MAKPPQPLNERIEQLRAEIDAFIDSLVEKDVGYGVPREALRALITNRANGCQCRQYLIATGELK
jgi:hypothetical protein